MQFLDDSIKKAIQNVTFPYKGKRDQALLALGYEENKFKEKVTAIRKQAFLNFEDNLAKAKELLQSNGFQVHEAKDSSEAKNIIRTLLQGVDRVAKSKSNTGREIGLDKLLKELYGDRYVFETDLGDFLVELFQTEDMHYVLPAIHLTPEKIQEKIKQHFGDNVAADATELTHYLCAKIRENIQQAEVGITGANFFTATGQVVLLENEGNISLVSRLPQKHILVTGIDKLVNSVEDATQLCQAAAIFGTGQKLTQYISVISGPSKTADIQNQMVLGAQGTHEVHIVLVDNGRREMLKTGFGDLLRCINCGSCINFCPVYHNLGTKYGGTYLGSKGIVMTAFCSSVESKESEPTTKNRQNLQSSEKLGSFQCTLCGNCLENCPMKIDLPEMVKKIRNLQFNEDIVTDANREMLEKIKKHGNPFGEIADSDIPDKLYCC